MLVGFTGTISHGLGHMLSPTGGLCVRANGGQSFVHSGVSGFGDVHSERTHADRMTTARRHIPTTPALQPGRPSWRTRLRGDHPQQRPVLSRPVRDTVWW